MDRRKFIKGIAFGLGALAVPAIAKKQVLGHFYRGDNPFIAPPVEVPHTGFTNPAKCMLSILQDLMGYEDDEIDLESFDRVAEQLEGTIPPEVIADGFAIGEGHLTYEEGANRLCDIGNFVVYMDHQDNKFKCVDANEWGPEVLPG